ncbi:MAG: hypothetical protein ACXW17_16230, partial [Methylomagnum sp.]
NPRRSRRFRQFREFRLKKQCPFGNQSLRLPHPPPNLSRQRQESPRQGRFNPWVPRFPARLVPSVPSPKKTTEPLKAAPL